MEKGEDVLLSRLKSTKPKLMTGFAILMLLLTVISTVRFVGPTEALLLGASFEKYAGNPLSTIPLYTASGVVHPDVLYFSGGKDGYEYWMVYTPFEPERAPCIVRSNDGISWTDTGIANPVASEGVLDSDPDMIYVSALNTWLMVCTTYWSGEESKIWLAYSTDGKNWTKYDGIPINGNTNPYILSGTDDGNQTWEYVGSYSKLTEPTLFYEDGTFYLYFCTWTPDENRGKVGLATFTWDNSNNDIQNFQRNAVNPLIDLAADSIFKSGCGHLDVSKLGSTYYMYVVRELAGSANYELALLTSTDKISWTNQGRVLERGSPGAWDDVHIYRSSATVDPTGQIVLFDGKMKLYYSAWPSSIAYGSDPKIGLATGSLQYAPQYRNVGPVNGISIGVGENLTLYAQGYDDTGLDWAWLWTNETGGVGKNYTDIWDFQPSVSNPIIDGDSLFGSGMRTEDSKVVKHNGTYYMAMASGTAGPTMDIYMLNSSSLTGPWVLMNNGNPIISRNATDWDAEWLRVQGPIVYYNGTYYLYYMGGDGSTFRIGVATANYTSFPLTWTKYSGNPILEPTGSGWESDRILSLSIQRIGPAGNEWYGHYGALGGGYYATGVCYSSSPYGPFTRHPDNPIIERGVGEWDDLGPIVKDMIKVGDTILGVYEAKNPYWQVGLYSGEITDGILNVTFSKHPDNPVIAGDEGSGTETANPAWYYEDQELYLLINSYSSNWRYFDLFSGRPSPYGSPLNTNDVADTWTWSNFTWCNTSIADDTQINWRIYYSDTSGNENVTDTHYFTVKTEAPEYDYVDLNTSNMDASEDKGTHSDFEAEKAVDGYDTLIEQSAGAFGIMSYRKNITINHAYVDGDQNNFPVLIDIYDSDLHDDVQSDGDDIDFTDSSGSNLDHEIEHFNKNYNSTHAHLIAWVRANLTGASDTTICMIYGNPTCGSQQSSTGVWDSDYMGVWHLDASSSPDQDSSANNEGAAWFNTPIQTDAQIGKGKDFDAGDGTKTAEDSDHTAASITVEGWVNGDTFSNTETWNEATFFQRYFTYYFMISKDVTNRGKPKVYLYTSGTSNWRLADTALDVGKWHYLAFTYTSGSLRIYINGTLDKEYTDVTGDVQAGGGSGSQFIYFGAQDSGSPFRTLDGKLDEMRLSRGVRSPEWLNSTYQNVANLADFLSVGNEESPPLTNYELDLEIQWTNVNYTRPSEILCIKTGTFSGSEDIQVRIWNSTDSSWGPIMNLTANQWNNVSVTSYLTESTFTVQFLGGTESGDTTQDSWNIGSSLLHTHSILPTFMLTVNSAFGGTTSPPAGTYTYDENEIATVTATPNPDYYFDYWEYDGHTSTNNPISLTMSEDYTLTPVFIHSGPGAPKFLTINSAVGGTTDPPAGTYTYDENEIATVTATAHSSYYFGHWEYNGHTSASNPIMITMSQDYTLTPVFIYSGPSVPEFPMGPAMGILFAPIVIYMLCRSRQRKKVCTHSMHAE